jgi:methylase of polypeptide subunit release factors
MSSASGHPETLTTRFGPLVVSYDERVIEPRPWTEAQSRWAAEIADVAPPGPMLELCAGAGHIGLLAALLTGRDLVQVEADPVAAHFSQVNAVRAGIAEQVTIRCCDLEEALGPDESFAIVMADPPYLPTDQVDRWPADPPTAIDGGADGLRLVRSCLAIIERHLVGGGTGILQVWGERQALQVADLVAGRHAGLTVGELRSEDDDRALLALHPRER